MADRSFAPGFTDEDMARRDARERGLASERSAAGPWVGLSRSDAPIPEEQPQGDPNNPWAGLSEANGASPQAEDPLRAAAVESLKQRGILDQYGELADAEENGALQLWSLQGAEIPVTQTNPDYEHRKRNYGEMLDANYREQGAQDIIDEGQMAQHRVAADALDQVAEAEQRSYDRQQARMFAQEEAALAAEDRSRRAYDTADQATRRMLQASEISTDRWWASRTAGQKVAAVGAMLARGFTGRDPFDIINTEINRDIDAQKATFMNLATTYGAASNNVNLARGLYADIRARTADEREADQIFRLAKLQTLKAQFEATAARVGLPMMQAQIQQARAQFDTRILQARETLETLITHNVKKRTVMRQAKRAVQLADGTIVYVPVGGAGDMAAAKHLGESSREVRKAGLDVVGKQIEVGGKEAAKSARVSVAEANLRERQRRSVADVAEEVAPALKGIDEYLKRWPDAPGRSEGTVFGRGMKLPNMTEDMMNENVEREAVLKLIGFGFGGKQLTGTELQTFQQQLSDEFATLSGKQIRERMKHWRGILASRVKAAKSGLPMDVAESADGAGLGYGDIGDGLEGTEE